MNLADVFIRRPVAAVMFIAAFVVFGIFSYPRIGVDLYPDVDVPVVTVTVIYPGADPATMESEVAEKLEEEINTLTGLDGLRSINLEGVTQVIAEFELSIDGDDAAQDIRERVAKIEHELPEGIDPPVVEKFDVGAAPVMTIAVSGDLPIRELTRIAKDELKEPLQRIQGVGGIDVVGGREREVQVFVDPDRLAGLGLTATDVAQAIQAQNLEIPGGNYETGQRELSVITRGDLTTAAEISNILLPTVSAAIRIRDVAEVRDSVEDARSWSALDGEQTIALVVRKQAGGNTVELAHAVHSKVTELQPKLEKLGARAEVPKDNSVFIEHTIDDVKFDLVFGGILAVVIILVMLMDWRATTISAVALPTSVIATFAFVQAMGFTFNNLTMLALTLSIGILIDDAIVVIENIHRHLTLGKTAMEAASDATKEIFLPVVAMTSSIVAVFVPVAFMKGIIGRFFYQFGLTVSFAVAISMVVSFTLTPMLSSRFLKHHNEEKSNIFTRIVDGVMGGLERVYESLIRWALRRKLLVIAFSVLLLVGSAALITQVPTEFVPSSDRSEFAVSVELPTGTNLATSRAFVAAIADDLRTNAPSVEHVLATVGGGAQGQVNEGKIEVFLVNSKERDFSQQDLMSWVRDRYADVDQAKITVNEIPEIGGDSGMRQQPVQLYLHGSNLDELNEHAEAVIAELKKYPGFVDFDTTFRGGKPELAIDVDRERAAALGVPVASVATMVRTLVAGDTITDLKIDGEVTDVTLRLADEDKHRLETLSGLEVRSTTGELVDIANLVRATPSTGPSRIERSAQQREVMVLAGIEPSLPLSTALEVVEETGARLLPANIEHGFEGRGSMMSESFGYMIEALILAIILVYMILAAQFDSFVQPVTIMISLPLSVVGAFGSLYLVGMTMSVYGMIGIIMLMGLVTKNAILLVDFANQSRAEGDTLVDALAKAGRLRLRPILMTTAAMVFGMLPVALALGEGGEARAPMAVCVIGGLLTSTLLTLIVIPVVYALFEGLNTKRPISQLVRRFLKSKPDEVPAQ